VFYVIFNEDQVCLEDVLSTARSSGLGRFLATTTRYTVDRTSSYAYLILIASRVPKKNILGTVLKSLFFRVLLWVDGKEQGP
jgi:hypothetical protein